VDETFPISRTDLGTIGYAEEIRVTIISKSAIEFFAWGHYKRLKGVPRLRRDK
jgi:hypothetical protein